MTPIEIHSMIDSRIFIRFARYNAYRKNRSWRNPLLFAVIMVFFSLICFFPAAQIEGSRLLGIVLLVIGIGLPLVYFSQFEASLRKQCKALHLQNPREVYIVQLTAEGIDICGGKDQMNMTPVHYQWSDLAAYRKTDDCIYLYAKAGNAYLLPISNTETEKRVLQLFADNIK